MKHYLYSAIAAAGLGLLVSWVPGSTAQDAIDKNNDNNVEVLARGPVHEGYAEPVNQAAEAPPAIAKAPPDPVPELPPEQKPEGDNVQWIPGYWQWDDDRSDFIWISGFWRQPPPGRTWVPGHWQKVESGWQWTPGFWSGGEQQFQYV